MYYSHQGLRLPWNYHVVKVMLVKGIFKLGIWSESTAEDPCKLIRILTRIIHNIPGKINMFLAPPMMNCSKIRHYHNMQTVTDLPLTLMKRCWPDFIATDYFFDYLSLGWLSFTIHQLQKYQLPRLNTGRDRAFTQKLWFNQFGYRQSAVYTLRHVFTVLVIDDLELCLFLILSLKWRRRFNATWHIACQNINFLAITFSYWRKYASTYAPYDSRIYQPNKFLLQNFCFSDTWHLFII